MLWWVASVIVYDVCGGGFSVNVEGDCVVCVIIDGYVYIV
jgi:hypothetical protein